MARKIKGEKRFWIIAVSAIALFLIYNYIDFLDIIGGYEKIFDLGFVVYSLIMSGYCMTRFFQEKRYFLAYLLLLNLFFAIAVIHLLKIFYGGLLC